MKHIDAAIAIVARDGKILITQRKADDTFGGYWEFPGGKVEPGEDDAGALARVLTEDRPVLRDKRVDHVLVREQAIGANGRSGWSVIRSRDTNRRWRHGRAFVSADGHRVHADLRRAGGIDADAADCPPCDDACLSTAYGRNTVYIAVHMYRGMVWEPYFRAVEEYEPLVGLRSQVTPQSR